MNEETSRIIIATLLIVAILISSYLTFIAFKYRSALSEEPRVRNTLQSAEVILTVLPPPDVQGPEEELNEERVA